jgi:hypothetical protein
MEGIDANGLGNWSAVSTHVGSKTAAQCKDHYFDIYVRQGPSTRTFSCVLEIPLSLRTIAITTPPPLIA